MAAVARGESAAAGGVSEAGASPRSVQLREAGLAAGAAARRALVGLAAAGKERGEAAGEERDEAAGEEQDDADERSALDAEGLLQALLQAQLEPATTARPGAVLDVSRPRGLRIPSRGAPASYDEPELDGLVGLPRGLAAELDHIRSACEKLLESMDDIEGNLLSASGRTATGVFSPRVGASPRRLSAPEQMRTASSPRSSPPRDAPPMRHSLPATSAEVVADAAACAASVSRSPRRNNPRPSTAASGRGRSRPAASPPAAGARFQREGPAAPPALTISPNAAVPVTSTTTSTVRLPARRAGLFETAKRMV
jgi:hypothetical protein